MRDLPSKIYRAAQVRQIDGLAIEGGIPGYTLMCRAGKAALSELSRRWPKAKRLLILCGAGNNAGDGYVVARLGLESGYKPLVAALMNPEGLTGDARLAWQTYVQAGGRVVEWDSDLMAASDVVVDGILGTGIQRPLTGRPKQVVECINTTQLPVMALDVPTGLDADTGHVLGSAINADVTVTFVGLKLGLYTGAAWEHTGDIVFDDLDISASIRDSVHFAGTRIDENLIPQVLPQRKRIAHKGDCGRVLLIGGGDGMPGAIRLAGEAALFAGAGTVTVATRPEHVNTIVTCRPEIMCRGVSQGRDLDALLQRTDVVAIGPGLGQEKWGAELLRRVLDMPLLPLVVDADALNLLAKNPVKRSNWVLTPHPGEAARLLASDIGSVQQDRLGAVARLLEVYGGVVVLKGPGTVVARAGEGPWVCDRGNPGMAAPGMGDVLTGTIAGIAGQCGDLFDAARVGVFVHGASGDDGAAISGERGLIASDLFPHLVRWVNRV